MAVNSPEVQELLRRIKTEQEASGEQNDVLSFQDFWDAKYAQLAYYLDLTSYHEGASGIVKPIKRVIRKAVAFLFLPLVAAQNNINLAIARLFIHVRSYVGRDKSERDRLALRSHELEVRLDTQRAMIEELQAQVQELRALVDAQKGDSQ